MRLTNPPTPVLPDDIDNDNDNNDDSKDKVFPSRMEPLF